jgi:hypothetical protein
VAPLGKLCLGLGRSGKAQARRCVVTFLNGVSNA